MCVVYLVLLMIRMSMCRTSIRTFDKVKLKENVGINTTVMNLKKNNEIKWNEVRKMNLLNLNGFETNLFEIVKDELRTREEIDREEFVVKKWCLDRLNCLIELHLLINDGEEYWVIEIEIVDENDQKPKFKEKETKLKFVLNNLNENTIPFEGSIDEDGEEEFNKIYYYLDCSKDDEEIDLNWNERTKNCFPIFDLVIFSQSLINQNDQLGLKLNPSSSSMMKRYELKLFSFNKNRNGKKEKINSMKIFVEIEKILFPPKFDQSNYNFILLNRSMNDRRRIKIGEVFARSNDENEKVFYRLKTKRKEIEIDEKTGKMFLLLNDEMNSNEFHFFVESFYSSNSQMKSSTNVHFLIRDLNEMKNNLKIEFQMISSFVKQINKTNSFQINKNENISSNEVLFNLSIESTIYPFDYFDLYLHNSSLFSVSPLVDQMNQYEVKLKNGKDFVRSSSELFIQIKHRLTNQFISNLNLTFILHSSLCFIDTKYFLYNLNDTKQIGTLQVIQTNEILSSFSRFSLQNPNEILIDECQMRIMNNSTLNQSEYQLCSFAFNRCFQISSNKPQGKILSLKKILKIRSIEILILCFTLIFVLSTTTLIIIICYLRGFHFCLSMKNYLFYGKKYGLNHSQHQHKNHLNVRFCLSSLLSFTLLPLEWNSVNRCEGMSIIHQQ